MTGIFATSTWNHLGTIVCKHCGETIDTVDTEKVHFFYVTCGGPQCTDVAAEPFFDAMED